jgi:hypothetical protein
MALDRDIRADQKCMRMVDVNVGVGSSTSTSTSTSTVPAPAPAPAPACVQLARIGIRMMDMNAKTRLKVQDALPMLEALERCL